MGETTPLLGYGEACRLMRDAERQVWDQALAALDVGQMAMFG